MRKSRSIQKIVISESDVRTVLAHILLIENEVGFIHEAKAYAETALVRDMTGEELRVQILYVLNNLSYWRGESARLAKKILKQYLKELS